MNPQNKALLAKLKAETVELDAAIELTRAKVAELEESKRARELRAYGIKFGLFAGCRVVDEKGRTFTVICIESHSWNDPFASNDKPWLRVALIKKDGTASTRMQTLFRNYRVVEAKP